MWFDLFLLAVCHTFLFFCCCFFPFVLNDPSYYITLLFTPIFFFCALHCKDHIHHTVTRPPSLFLLCLHIFPVNNQYTHIILMHERRSLPSCLEFSIPHGFCLQPRYRHEAARCDSVELFRLQAGVNRKLIDIRMVNHLPVNLE